MKTMDRPRSQSETPSISHEVINWTQLIPNDWNPNRMTAMMYSKAIESIQTYGFIDPITVRPLTGIAYEIIDGEHRYQAGKDLGIEDFPCVVLSGLSDAAAKKLTIVLNELHGQADPDKMGPLLQSILSDTSLDDLLTALPFDESVLAAYIGQSDLPALPDLPSKPEPEASDKEPWVERTFRLPKTAALVVDEAMEKAADGEAIEKWQALERIAADYLAG